jgi:CubicO group peptidase (beta-lactamase class C family)
MLVAMGLQDLTSARRSLTSGDASAGGLLTSAIDTARFTHALFQGRLVGEPGLQEMMQVVDTTHLHGVDALPEQFGYGLGMRAWQVDGEKLYGHTGHLFGYSSVTMHNPEKGYTITVLSNLSIIDQAQMIRQFQEVLLNEE